MVAFENDIARFEAANAQVLGVSVDSVPAHRVFAEQQGGLSFPLLADFHPKGALAQQYGVWLDEHGFSARAVFVIDKQGIIRWSKVYERALPDNEEILSILGELGAA